MAECMINGSRSDQVAVNDRGLAFGDGCFETIAVKDGEPLLWQRHVQRLFDSCDALGIPVDFSEHQLRGEAKQLLSRDGNAVLKITVTRGTGGQGYRADNNGPATRILCSLPWRSRSASLHREGARLTVCETRLACNPRLAGIKHLNRLEQVLARAEWRDEYDEGLMLGTNDLVIEGTMSNVFLQAGGEIITPSLDECGVAGVMREEILAQLEKQGVPCKQAAVTLDMVYKSDAVFVCNSLIGLWPVNALADKTYPVTELEKQIQHDIENVTVTE
jgi:4-amino-4-deoxychorismate lyase